MKLTIVANPTRAINPVLLTAFKASQAGLLAKPKKAKWWAEPLAVITHLTPHE